MFSPSHPSCLLQDLGSLPQNKHWDVPRCWAAPASRPTSTGAYPVPKSPQTSTVQQMEVTGGKGQRKPLGSPQPEPVPLSAPLCSAESKQRASRAAGSAEGGVSSLTLTNGLCLRNFDFFFPEKSAVWEESTSWEPAEKQPQLHLQSTGELSSVCFCASASGLGQGWVQG